MSHLAFFDIYCSYTEPVRWTPAGGLSLMLNVHCQLDWIWSQLGVIALGMSVRAREVERKREDAL